MPRETASVASLKTLATGRLFKRSELADPAPATCVISHTSPRRILLPHLGGSMRRSPRLNRLLQYCFLFILTAAYTAGASGSMTEERHPF
jgi:hypothetical protein